mgnify:CR=1 FL=1
MLLFFTAIVYAKEIYVMSRSLDFVMDTFEKWDEADPKDILEKQLKKQLTMRKRSQP